MGDILTMTNLSEDARLVDLRVVITRLVSQGSSAEQIRTISRQWGELVASPPLSVAQVDDVLQDQLLRLTPTQAVREPPVQFDDEKPPVEVQAERAALEVDREASFEKQREQAYERTPSRLLSLPDLSASDAPPFTWWIPGWLSPHPTLLSGRGGVGKSLLALQLAMSLAAGKPLLGGSCERRKVLYWACEDDVDEIHRRLKAIAEHMEIDLADLDGWLYIDARLGLDNTLLTTEFGRPVWTSQIETLRVQLNELQIDVLILDNLAHVFTASENDRSAVTMFTSGICGLVTDRPWCPILIGHVAKSQGSEYAGSTAWENAVRMRWFLGRTLPDARDDEDAIPDDSSRVLAKRKSNYSADDVIKLRVEGRIFTVEQPEDDAGVVGSIRASNARKAVLDGLEWLREHHIDASDQYSRAYLPKLLVQYEQAGTHTKKDLERAMRQLIGSGQIERAIVGKTSNRMPKYGLVARDIDVEG